MALSSSLVVRVVRRPQMRHVAPMPASTTPPLLPELTLTGLDQAHASGVKRSSFRNLRTFVLRAANGISSPSRHLGRDPAGRTWGQRSPGATRTRALAEPAEGALVLGDGDDDSVEPLL